MPCIMEDSRDRKKHNIICYKWQAQMEEYFRNLWSMAGFIFALDFKNNCVGYHEVSQPQDSNLN